MERQKIGLSKAELARKADITDSNYCQLELGQRDPFEPELERLSNALGVPKEELFREANEEEVNKIVN